MKKNLSVLLVASTILTSFLFVLNAIAATSELRCDVTFDGKVSADDARLILRYSVGLEPFTDEQKEYADANGDGSITAADARIALRISVGLEGDDDEPTTNPNEPTTDTEEPTTNNDEIPTYPWDVEGYDDSNLDYMSINYMSPERAGLIYNNNGYRTTYEELAEGEWYYTYDEVGTCLRKRKPYSPENEPTTRDISICEYCGKSRIPGTDGTKASALGGCTRYIKDMTCKECGVLVKANTCHTCGQ